jgi:hypothetical protein
MAPEPIVVQARSTKYDETVVLVAYRAAEEYLAERFPDYTAEVTAAVGKALEQLYEKEQADPAKLDGWFKKAAEGHLVDDLRKHGLVDKPGHVTKCAHDWVATTDTDYGCTKCGDLGKRNRAGIVVPRKRAGEKLPVSLHYRDADGNLQVHEAEAEFDGSASEPLMLTDSTDEQVKRAERRRGAEQEISAVLNQAGLTDEDAADRLAALHADRDTPSDFDRHWARQPRHTPDEPRVTVTVVQPTASYAGKRLAVGDAIEVDAAEARHLEAIGLVAGEIPPAPPAAKQRGTTDTAAIRHLCRLQLHADRLRRDGEVEKAAYVTVNLARVAAAIEGDISRRSSDTWRKAVKALLDDQASIEERSRVHFPRKRST